jgi:hypothetical protein
MSTEGDATDAETMGEAIGGDGTLGVGTGTAAVTTLEGHGATGDRGRGRERTLRPEGPADPGPEEAVGEGAATTAADTASVALGNAAGQGSVVALGRSVGLESDEESEEWSVAVLTGADSHGAPDEKGEKDSVTARSFGETAAGEEPDSSLDKGASAGWELACVSQATTPMITAGPSFRPSHVAHTPPTGRLPAITELRVQLGHWRQSHPLLDVS